MKLANAFTLSRAILAPIFFLVYFIPIWTNSFVVLSAFIMIPLLACMEFTDFLDGFFARKNKTVSDLGKMFDPFADVIVHLTTFACFMHSYNQSIVSYLPIAIFILILYREFTQNFLRMLAAKKGVAIAARKGGKLKTVLYVTVSFVCLIQECANRLYACEILSPIVESIAKNYSTWKNATLVIFIICLVASYASFVDYLINFKPILKKFDE